MALLLPFHVANGLEWPWNQLGHERDGSDSTFPSLVAGRWASGHPPRIKSQSLYLWAARWGELSEVWPAVCEHLDCPVPLVMRKRLFVVQKHATISRNDSTLALGHCL